MNLCHAASKLQISGRRPGQTLQPPMAPTLSGTTLTRIRFDASDAASSVLVVGREFANIAGLEGEIHGVSD